MLNKYHDFITGLPNKKYFCENYSQNISEFVVVLIDIDDFKYINDTFGHSFGDKFLALIGKELSKIINNNGEVFMYSEDEFIITMFNNDLELVNKKINTILQRLQNVFIIDKNEVTTSVSIGVYISQNHDTIDDVLRKADIALYEAKKKGKGRTIFYNYDIEKKITREANITRELRKLNKEEFYILYQPIYDIYEKKVVEVEALIRWQNKELGRISPGEFIPIAEEKNLIEDLGFWVIENVGNQIKYWNKKGINLQVAINISPNQLNENNFIDKLINLFYSTKLDFDKIKFEITETQILKLKEKNLKILDKLKNLGINITLDDFGVGYSSFKNMAFFPVSEIKIDKIFIDYINKDEKIFNLIKSIIFTAHNLGYKITAEGVENKDQYYKLLELGCDKIQGYYIEKPVNAKVIENKYGKN